MTDDPPSISAWDTAPSKSEAASSSSASAASSSTSPSSTSSSAPAPTPTFFGLLTYKLGQYVTMVDIIANNTTYQSHSTDPKDPESHTVNLLTDKPNVAKRRFEIYDPDPYGDWGSETEGSVLILGCTCTITLNPDKNNENNRPSFEVWDTPIYQYATDTDDKLVVECVGAEDSGREDGKQCKEWSNKERTPPAPP